MDSDEVRKRKEYAERKVKERHAALRKEAEERRKHTVEHRESFRVQSQLKREQVLLQKHMQKLNEDEERKAATLAKQHEATSRMAAISRSPNKSFAFGSSTPRTLAYLDNLPKSEQQYDKKLRPLEGGSPAPSPVSTSPNTKPYRLSSTPQRAPPAAHRPAPAMTSMTSSMYVTSSAPPTRHLKAKPPQITNRTTSSTTRNSMMTQSVYTPSRPVTSTTTSSLNSRITKKTPIRPTTAATSSSGAVGRRSMDVRKPPMPRKSMPAEVKKIAEESPREVPEVLVVPEVAPQVAPNMVETTPEVHAAPEAILAPEAAPEVVESAPEAQKPSEEIQEAPEVILAPEVAPEVVESAPEPVSEIVPELIQIDDKIQEDVQDAPELISEHTSEQTPEHTPELVEEKIIVPDAPKTPEALEEEQAHQDAPEKQQVAPRTPEPTQLDAPEELLIPTTPEVVEVAPEAHHHEETLISITNEETGSTANNSLADELMEIRKTPEVEELHYPMPDEKHNDLVDVFGNDFINGARQPLPPAIQQHVEFDEDTDSGKASPTSSETSSTTDEVTPREEVKAVRVMPIVRSAEDIAKKEREAAEQEERKARLAAILAKSRGMASPLTNTLPPTAATISDSTPATTIAANASTTNSPPMTSPMAEATTSGEESAEKEAGGASDVLARLAAKTNLPSLQKILQRKQGSNPSLQTTESTGGEIY